MNEFQLIEHYFLAPRRASRSPGVLSSCRGAVSNLLDQPGNQRSKVELEVGAGDDCAVVRWAPRQRMSVSVDTAVEGVHFPERFKPEWVAHRAIGAAVSDLAAMGARPEGCLLALSVPSVDPDWFSAFSGRFHELLDCWNMELWGGDLTRGPLQISLTVFGSHDERSPVCRSGSRVGDSIWVTHTLGGAARGLKAVQQSLAAAQIADVEISWLQAAQTFSKHLEPAVQAYCEPQPRLKEGMWLAQHANAMIDISDGLVADAGHLALSSGLAFQIELAAVPVFRCAGTEIAASSANGTCGRDEDCQLALYGGDDYELLFTAARELDTTLSLAPFPVTKIGKVVEGTGVWLHSAAGLKPAARGGWMHFQ